MTRAEACALPAWKLVPCYECGAGIGQQCFSSDEKSAGVKVNKRGVAISHSARNEAGRKDRKRYPDVG